ncbi:type II toxin-antitoxin system RatA family toxin [Anaerobranca gottschalkii]|uniref:Ribosome association toxin PasT (RatA) of the RatAB toxin-antitoxin module n=1 Tax=Anaerobranca gottschalkii DSM 13577 TaxID=1120990 RepID=A0A1H9ZJS2_9FIRM|nr:aromatase/cyclase [Anaerobranca gottschalkii]SES81873.1 Ribosome association toxin PasT (RatA) of the RatAB toxin-antitoxin module [Anaerobranca gottschalkii DSM 13577]
MPFVETSITVKGNIEEIYPIVKDMESYPNFMESVKSVKVIERDGNTTLTKWETELKGKPFNWVERDTFYDEDYRITYQLVSGDLKKFEGQWTLTETEKGVEIHLTVDFEFGVPMIASLLNPIAKLIIKQNCDSMLTAIKQQIEG